jgi:oligoribonuclease NrnB/cAMP/cGMP phosphodiesterase (DHH superfamily)
MKCFYHNDLDGHCAGAIVYKYTKGEPFREFIEMDYHKPFPFDQIQKGEKVFIVDFSLPTPEDFIKLLDITEYVWWIDHHKSALEKHASVESRLMGMRSMDQAGCELTYLTFYGIDPIPEVVKLIGDYDVWAFKYGSRTRNFQSGARLYNTKPDSGIWDIWLDIEYVPVDEIEAGGIIEEYKSNFYKEYLEVWSFPVVFEGYKALCCNMGSTGSLLFESQANKYDIVIPCVFTGSVWKVSLFSSNPDIDCSELAKKYGGGGHKGAAGFYVEDLPFKKAKGQCERIC